MVVALASSVRTEVTPAVFNIFFYYGTLSSMVFSMGFISCDVTSNFLENHQVSEAVSSGIISM